MSRTQIHSTAVVSPEVELAPGVKIGPYAVLEGKCRLDRGVEIGPHAVIGPYVRLGEGVQVGPHCVLGGAPQDLGFGGGETWLEVGPGTVLREGVTAHRATRPDQPTRIGVGAYLMGYVHVGHDCQVGDGVILTQGVGLSGHCQVGPHAIIGGQAGLHQFVRVGAWAMVGGASKVSRDVLPFTLADGNPARHYRLNTVGLRRAGINGERYRVLEAAFRRLREGRSLEELPETEELRLLREFLQAPSKRQLSGFVRAEARLEG